LKFLAITEKMQQISGEYFCRTMHVQCLRSQYSTFIYC